ncbi:MAG: hypothetical protein KDK05_21855 [Candidatus Competibacteraceae bacterium]|nr:hypothetical protein [Candidatus Competibacteraceae bacterium]
MAITEDRELMNLLWDRLPEDDKGKPSHLFTDVKDGRIIMYRLEKERGEIHFYPMEWTTALWLAGNLWNQSILFIMDNEQITYDDALKRVELYYADLIARLEEMNKKEATQ